MDTARLAQRPLETLASISYDAMFTFSTQFIKVAVSMRYECLSACRIYYKQRQRSAKQETVFARCDNPLNLSPLVSIAVHNTHPPVKLAQCSTNTTEQKVVTAKCSHQDDMDHSGRRCAMQPEGFHKYIQCNFYSNTQSLELTGDSTALLFLLQTNDCSKV